MLPSPAASHSAPKRVPNPFLSAVSASPLDRNPADVSEINAAAFERCLALIADVREHHLTQSLSLFGEPGSGKTHLLSRLRESLEKDSLTGQESLFIPIRMVTSAGMLWRYLRRHLAVALLRQRADKTRALGRVIRVNRQEIQEQDRSLGIVLCNLSDGVHFADSAAWLRGEELPEEALHTLGVSALSDEDEHEAVSRRIVTLICSLGEPVPFVFCFDQLEALQNFHGDTTGFFKLGQTISDMYDSTRNVALLSCLQTSLLPQLEAAVRGADRDRMLNRRAALLPLNRDQAMKLVNARLDTVPGLKAQHPLNETGLNDLFIPEGLCVARKVIVRCQDLFNTWLQTPPAPPEPLDVALERKLRGYQRVPRIEDAEGILRSGLPAMVYLRGADLSLPERSNTALQGFVAGRKPSAIAICNQRPGQILIKRLEKVHADWQASGKPGLLILRDARNGIGVGAKKTREAVEKLEKAGARIVPVSQEALAVLEAISRLLAEARSGDLTHQGEPVAPATVEQWLSSHMPRAVDELLDTIGGEQAAPSDELVGMLTALLAKAKVITVADAASQLGRLPQEVEECGRRNTSLVGFAGGSKHVLFRVVERQQAGDQPD